MVPLLQKIQLNHDTFDFIFGLPQDDIVLGIGVGQHVVLQYESKKKNRVFI